MTVALGLRQDLTIGPKRWFSMMTSGRPVAGTCDITPSDGFYRSTLYTIRCLNFVDDDLPLTFLVNAVRDYGRGKAVQERLM